jgi:hypothetical protein
MSRTNCLYYVLDQLHDQGGYIRARLSGHIKNLHAQHVDQYGQMSHFVPPGKLDSAWQIFSGFEGAVVSQDQTASPPARIGAIWLGALSFFILTTAWAFRRAVVNLLRPIP